MPVEVRSLPFPPEDAEWWKVLLHRWGEMMDAYCSFFEGDAPYWYGERALTGLLAAAAWIVEGWSLEEFAAYRGQGEERGPARGDAWIGRNKERWYTLECKCAWIYTPDPASAIEQTHSKLNDAKDQLDSLNGDYRGKSVLAVCYVVPGLARDEATGEKIQALFDAIAMHFQRSALVAIYHPPDERSPEWDGRYYPGVVMVASLFAGNDERRAIS